MPSKTPSVNAWHFDPPSRTLVRTYASYLLRIPLRVATRPEAKLGVGSRLWLQVTGCAPIHAMLGIERSRDKFFAIYYIEHANHKLPIHLAVPVPWAEESTIGSSFSFWHEFVQAVAVSILKAVDPNYVHPLLNPQLYISESPVRTPADSSHNAVNKFMDRHLADKRARELAHDRKLIAALIRATRKVGEEGENAIMEEWLREIDREKIEEEEDQKKQEEADGLALTNDNILARRNGQEEVQLVWTGVEWYETEAGKNDVQ
jgi:hypothetical protein